MIDAIDDKEVSGSLVSLLENGSEFVKNNSKMKWKKAGDGRIDLPDYPERSVLEGLVNALIHRDIDKIPSKRRNPVIADIFDRLKYMERRGSGFKRLEKITRGNTCIRNL